MRHSIFVFLAATVFFGSNTGLSQIVIQHSGATDPLTEGFSILTPGEVEHGPMLDDQGFDAWSIQDGHNADFSSYRYQLLPEEEVAASIHGWVLSGTMRFLEFGVARLAFMTGSEDFSFYLTLDDKGDITLARQQVPLYTLSGGGTDYHEYALVYDPIDATAILWIDGSIRGTNIGAVPSLSPPIVIFGSGGRFAHTHWNDVTLAIVPEPATVALIAGLGVLLVVGGMRWRKRKVGLKA